MKWFARKDLARLARIAQGVGLAVTLAAQEPGAADLGRLYSSAQAAQSRGDLAGAIGYYERIVKASPALAEAHANLGSLYYQTGQDAKALASLKKAVGLKPGLDGAYFPIGALSYKARQFSEARRHLKHTERVQPDHPLVQLYLGFVAEATRELPQAASHLEAATRQPESRVDAYYHLSKVYSDLARAHLDELVRRFPDSPYAHLAQGRTREAQRRWVDAREAYRQALAARPGDAALAARLAWIERAESDPGETTPPPDAFAAEDSSRLLYAPPRGPEIATLLAAYQGKTRPAGPNGLRDRELFERGEAYRAMAFLATLWVVENDSESFRVHHMRAQALEATGQLEEALAEYRRALAIQPGLDNVNFAIGNLNWVQGRFEEAIGPLEAELKVNPYHAEALYELGEIMINRSEFAEAARYLRRCLELAPDLAPAHLAMEKALTETGDLEGALAHLKKAIELSPAEATAYYRLALLYRKMQRPEEAKQALATFERLRAASRGASADRAGAP